MWSVNQPAVLAICKKGDTVTHFNILGDVVQQCWEGHFVWLVVSFPVFITQQSSLSQHPTSKRHYQPWDAGEMDVVLW